MISILFILFGVSVVFLPWWVVVPLGIGVSTFKYGAYVTLLGGVVLDATFGTPVAMLGGLSFVYTALFAGISMLVWFLSSRMVE